MVAHESVQSSTLSSFLLPKGLHSMSLWDQARDSFVQQLHQQHEDISLIEKFLSDKASISDAQQSVEHLRTESDRKYGSGDGRSKGAPSKWIRRIMENLEKLTSFGDVVMTAAPESIGLAWFAVKQVLNAVQNDYKLYETFGTALNDITEILVLVQAYEEIHHNHTTSDKGAIYQWLSKSIVDVYTSILDFSYAVSKHLTSNMRTKLKNAFKDIVGALNREFEGKTNTIKEQKAKIIDYSAAAFQKSSTEKMGDVSDELATIRQTMREAFDAYQQSSNDWREILRELKATQKLSHYELAMMDHEKNMKLLTPWLDTNNMILSAYIRERETGTCEWIQELPGFAAWRDRGKSDLLCVTGEAGTGKSVLGAFVHETLDAAEAEDEHTLVQHISQDIKSSEEKGDTLDRVENTLIRGIYEQARADTGDELLLQRCNALFTRQKQPKSKDGSGRNEGAERLGRSGNTASDYLPDFLDLYPSLITQLNKRVTIIMDSVDGMTNDDQEKLVERLIKLRDNSKIRIRILLLCRPSSHMWMKMCDQSVTRISIADHNRSDIDTIISKGLLMIPSLSSTEKKEIEDAITQKAGHRIRYVKQVVLPFLRTPFQRPVADWLKHLPGDVNETYHQHLRQLAPSYRQLLRAALGWVLFARGPLLVSEIMDAYSRLYLSSDMSQEQNNEETNMELYREQIRKAGGPFLDILDNGYVVLTDDHAVREFCISDKVKPSDSTDMLPKCTTCSKTLQGDEAFTISEKQEHLNLAITCVKHLNSNSYQAHFYPWALEQAGSKLQEKQISNDKEPCETQGSEGVDRDLQDVNQTNEVDTAQDNIPVPNAELENETGDNKPQPQANDESQTKEDDADSRFSDLEDLDRDDFENSVDGSEWHGDRSSNRPPYETSNWFYHVQEAERLWTAEERNANADWQALFRELELFFLTNPVAFEAWKLVYGWYQAEDWHPIHFAAFWGLKSLAELVIDKGAKVMDPTPDDDLTALHIAAYAPNRLEMLRLLLNHGGDLNHEGPSFTVFHYWMLQTDLDIACVEELLRNNASCSMVNENGLTALHYFASNGSDPKVLNLLLENPFDPKNCAQVNALDGAGQTPLHRLLCRQEIPLDLVDEFLKCKANIDLDDSDSERPLFTAALWGNLAAVKAIIERVTDVDDDNTAGETALHGAAWSGRHEIVKLLLNRGANIHRKAAHNRTPLLFACLIRRHDFQQNGNHEETAELLVRELISRHTPFQDINVCTKRGRTPLREAAGRGFKKVVASILEQMGPEDKEWINRRDNQKGRSPLHSAAIYGRAEVIELLVQAGADTKLRDGEKGDGMTSLQLCLDRWTVVGSRRYEDAICRLIDACPDEAKKEKLLVSTAAIQGSVPVLEKLANVGVQFDLPDIYGWTPGELASYFGHSEAANIITKSLLSRRLRPTQWLLDDGSATTTLEDNGERIVHKGESRLTLTSNHPVPAGLAAYYYEVELLNFETDSETTGDEQQSEIALGFCTSAGKLIEFPGWVPLKAAPNVQSWAYHGDDGGFYASDRKRWLPKCGKHYGPGDTVGIGLEADAQRIFFTRNGVRIEEQGFSDVKGRVFPALGLSDRVQLRTNFGTDPSRPLKWKLESVQANGERKVPDNSRVNGE